MGRRHVRLTGGPRRAPAASCAHVDSCTGCRGTGEPINARAPPRGRIPFLILRSSCSESTATATTAIRRPGDAPPRRCRSAPRGGAWALRLVEARRSRRRWLEHPPVSSPVAGSKISDVAQPDNATMGWRGL
ncbi:hypothetical protein NL676_020447 [Syzygium grande]|nr:hypothetical protein NL676_020447 [Syzygium grande]